MTVCPECLRAEFSQAPRTEDEAGRSAVRQVSESSQRRALARAARLSGGFQSGSAYTPYGGLRFALGLMIFIVCLLMFMFGADVEEWQEYAFLPAGAQRPVSIILCWVAAALVFSSSRSNKVIVYPLVAFLLLAGWFMPNFWSLLAEQKKKETAVAIAASKVEADETSAAAAAQAARAGRELTEEDLAIFREKKQSEGGVVNYGIYINTRDVGLRQSIRDTIARLLVAENCVAYTRGQGTLFIVSRSAGGTRNISSTVARFGDLNYASPSEGIYEVNFLPDKVCAVSRYPSETLSSPDDAAFVQANIAELRNLLDPHRVSTAAHTLAAANIKEQRDEVRNALVEVLRDPWAIVPDTYQALVEAMVVYAAPGDKEAVDVCRKYFLSSRLARRNPSSAIMELLIRETPAEMVAPVVELWCANPVEWGNTLAQLGTLSQDHLLEVLENTQSLQLIGPILKHLENHGTPEAIPAVKKYAEHPDSLISRSARATLRVLERQAH